jgi:hypothetical protein
MRKMDGKEWNWAASVACNYAELTSGGQPVGIPIPLHLERNETHAW